jgi:glycosyltransferase involved in cell wall biosynthesis
VEYSIRPLKILLVHRYFWPDTPPYAVILKKIAARLASDGHDVVVVSTQPGYKPTVSKPSQPAREKIDGFSVRRFRMLPSRWKIPGVGALNMFLFAMSLIMHAMANRKYDVVMTSTSPPVLAGWAARMAAWLCRSRLLYHCMDIHPEIGRLSGEFKNRTIFGFLKSIDLSTCKRASRTIVLSQDMKNSILARDTAAKLKIDVIQNFNLDQSTNDELVPQKLPNEFVKSPRVFRIVFAGNIGRFQGLPTLVDTFSKIEKNLPVELLLLGDGKQKKALQEQVANLQITNVKFFAHQPHAVAKKVLETADFGVISLNPEIYKYAYPTKLIAYLAAGCPVLSMLEEESCFANFVIENEIGVNIPAEDKVGLERVIRGSIENPDQIAHFRAKAKDVYDTYYNEVTVLDKWSALFSGILDPTEINV